VGLILLSFGSCAVIGFYAMHKMKQAGFDSELMKKNPGYAGAKMAVAAQEGHGNYRRERQNVHLDD
jgi:hypothetical protein